MGWIQQQFLGTLVIIFGTGNNTGLFVYNGTPAVGNPPIFWATSSTADPYGNTLPATAGVGSGGTFEVDGTETVVGTLNVTGTETVSGTLTVSGTENVSNTLNVTGTENVSGTLNVSGTESVTGKVTAGNTIINTTGLFVYSGTPAAGNLIGSVATAAGTDAFGNTFPIGVTTFGGASNNYEVTLNASATVNGVTVPSIQFAKKSTGNTQPFIGGDQEGSVTGSVLQDDSGTGSVTDVSSGVTRFSQVASGITGGQITLGAGFVRCFGGNLQVERAPAAPALLTQTANFGASAAGRAKFIPGEDNQTYDLGHVESSAAANQLINSTTATLVTGSTFNVGAAAYRLKWTVFYKGGQAAGAPVFSIGGTSTTTFIRWRNLFTTPGAPASFTAGLATAIATMTGPTLLNGALQLFEFEAFITFSASGTFTLLAAEGTNLDTFTIDSVFARQEPRQ